MSDTQQQVLPSGIELIETRYEPVNSSKTGGGKKGITPSCGCEGGNTTAVKVYAIGVLGYEFQTEANRDAFAQDMDGGNPDDPNQLINYLKANPEAAEDVVWTLSIDATPVYAVYPSGGYAPVLYNRIIDFFQSQLKGDSQRISIPGHIGGKIQLMSGQEIPVLIPKGQGMYSWSTEALVKAVLGETPAAAKADAPMTAKMIDFNNKQDGLNNFLNRVYYELRNLGISSEDRALNFAATNAFNAEKVFEKSANEGTELDTIEVEKSPICRPGSDCWDVKLTFFNPAKRMEEARRVYRFTVDVSHVIPVSVGQIRSWSIF